MTILMKDRLNDKAIDSLAYALKKSYPSFKEKDFACKSKKAIQPLALRQRVSAIIDALHLFLPKDKAKTARILKKTTLFLPKADNMAHYFLAWPLTDYMSVHALDEPALALPVLKSLTPFFSAEFAIRPFILHHDALTFAYLEKWCQDKNHHVRRLVSEGTRPRIPWGQHLTPFIKNPKPILPLLEQLKDDESHYVQKSVANNINAIAKDNPQVAIGLCQKWQKKASTKRLWVIKHGMRSLVKEGRKEVLALLGFTFPFSVQLLKFTFDKNIKIGDALSFSFMLVSSSEKEQHLVVDYVIYHKKANGTQIPKVFKLKNVILQPKEKKAFNKQHRFQQITTRQYYTGEHRLAIMVNGKILTEKKFYLSLK